MLDESDTYLLKPAEVALRLGVSRSWLYEAANAGRIPCVRLGGEDGPVRFREDELARWLDGASRRTVARASRDRTEPAAAGSAKGRPIEANGVEQLFWPLPAPENEATGRG